MTPSDFGSSFKDVLKERFSSPFYGTLILVWLVWNWKIVYLTIFVPGSAVEPLTKIEYIQEHYYNVCNLYVLPIVFTLAILLLFPYVINAVYRYYLEHEKKRRNLKYEFDAAQRLTVEESIQLRNRFSEREKRINEDLNNREAELKSYKEILEIRVTDLQERDARIAALMEEIKSFKILNAKYGAGIRFNDVTDVVSKLISSGEKFKIDNNTLGGDPVYGMRKELLIAYQTSSGSKLFLGREGKQIVVKDENISEAQVEPIDLSSLFPGRWKLVYEGKIKGEEVFEVRNLNEYYTLESSGRFEHAFNLEDVDINFNDRQISFTKCTVSGTETFRSCKLIIKSHGERYEGLEYDAGTMVIYTKVDSAE